MKNLLPVFFSLLFLCFEAKSQSSQQQAYIDSLDHLISIEKNDVAKLGLYQQVIGSLAENNPIAGLDYEKDAVALAKKLSNQNWTADLYSTIGRLHWRLGNFEQALKYHFEVLEIYEQQKDKKRIAGGQVQIGQDYADQGNYSDALKYFNLAMKKYEELGDKSNIARCYLYFAFVYGMLGNSAESTKANYEALKLFESLGDKYSTSIATSNLASEYEKMGKYDDALSYYQKAVEVLKSTSDLINLSSMYLSIGNVYIKKGKLNDAKTYYQMGLSTGKQINNAYCMAQSYESLADLSKINGQPDSALKYYIVAEGLYRSVSNKVNQASANINIGNLYFRMNQTEKAEEYFNQTFELADTLNNLSVLREYYQGVQALDSIRGDYKNAYLNYRKYITYRDSMDSEQNTKASMQTVMQYEFDKKEAASKAEQEKKDIRQRNFRNSMIGGAGFLVLLLIVIYNRYRFKQKANKSLHEAYENLKATQRQLIEAEKKATYGMMASRMAHEIQNPLNFVNNFSMLSSELTDEIENAADEEERKETISMLKLNLNKISEHGKRVSVIVKQLQEFTDKETIQEYFEEGNFSAG